MPWVRFDDQYPIHRKVAGLSDPAFRLHSAAIFWCARNGTDGFVPEEDLDQVCAQVRTPERFAAECVRRGTWHDAAYACASDTCPGPREGEGWVIHDYLEYQPTKEESDAAEKKQREQKSSGGKLGNHRRWHAARGVTDPDCPWCATAPPSVSDRYPIGGSDRSPIAPSRPDLSVVDVVSHLQVRNARAPDDDDFLSSVIDAIFVRTGVNTDAGHARKVAADILASAKSPVGNPAGYVLAAIEREQDPHARFLPPGVSQPLPALPDWCGKCDQRTRMRELDDGRAARCPDCHPRALEAS